MRMVDDWADGYTDSARAVNLYGPASANVPRSSVVSHQVRYRAPDTSDILLAPGQNPEDSVYSNAPGARMGQTKSRSGYNPPAGGGYTAETFPSSGGSGRRYARPERTQSRSRGSAPANGVKTRSAPLSGSDVTAAVMKAVKADGNTSFANWRQSLVNQGWDGDPSRIKYDPSTGKFVDTGGGVNGGAVTPEQTEAQASHRAESYPAEVGNTPVGGAQPAPASGAQPAPASGAQPAPASGAQPAPASGAQPAPASGAQPAPVSGAQPAPVSGAQSDAEIEQLRAQMRAEVNKLRGFGDFGNNAIALAQQWGDKILSDSGKSDVEQMQEMIKHLQWWNSIAPGIVKMNGGN